TMSGVGGGAIVNSAEVADARPGAAKVSVRGPALPVIDRPAKVATPPIAATAVAPPSVPPPEAIEAVTVAVDDVTTLPAGSRISTTGCVASTEPIVAPTGCVRMPSCVAAPAVTVTAREALAGVAVAVTVAVPTLTPVTTPLETLATVGSLLDQDTTAVTDLPPRFRTVAASVVVAPDCSVSAAGGASVTVAGVMSGGVVPSPQHAAMSVAASTAQCRARNGMREFRPGPAVGQC